MWLLQFVSLFSTQSDPTLERHFKGHREAVTSVDFSCSMKQIGNCYLSLLCVFVCVSLWPVYCFVKYVFCVHAQCNQFTHPPLSHRLYGLLCDDLEHETSDASVSFWWTQRCRHFCSVFSLRPPGGLCLQRQDCASLGAQHVSFEALFFSASLSSFIIIVLHQKAATKDNVADS